MRKFKIWFRRYDKDGNVLEEGVSTKEYAYMGTAQRVARERYFDMDDIRYVVSTRNPYIEYTRDDTCSLCGETFTTYEHTMGGAIGNSVVVRQCLDENGKPNQLRGYCDDIYYWAHRHMEHNHLCPTCTAKIMRYIDSLRKKDD